MFRFPFPSPLLATPLSPFWEGHASRRMLGFYEQGQLLAMSPRPPGSGGSRARPNTGSLRSNVIPAAGKRITRGSDQQKPQSASTQIEETSTHTTMQGITIQTEETSANTMSFEDEFTTNSCSIENDISNSDSKDKIGIAKK